MTKIVATIEARMTSKRLPGKVLLPVENKALLSYLVSRLQRTPSLHEIVLATTTRSEDDALASFAQKEGILLFRGSENNVMQRVIEAAQSVKADIVVEITGDCPLIDPEVIEQTIRLFQHNPCDYASNVQIRSYPIGMDTQVFALETLKKSYSMTNHPLDQEHVTRHIRLSPHLFKQLHLLAPPSCHWPELSLTLDEPEDHILIRNILQAFSGKISFSCADIIHLLKHIHPEWVFINEKVQRKGLHA